MRLRGLIVLCLCPALAGVDLGVKALVAAPPWALHQRSHAWVLLSLALLACALPLAALPSRAAATSAGVFAGGVLGNVLSALWNGLSVPNPLVLGSLAFTPGDVCVLVGLVGLTVAITAVSIRHRAHLLPPRRWEQALLRRLGA
jgi:hypothetical protein